MGKKAFFRYNKWISTNIHMDQIPTSDEPQLEPLLSWEAPSSAYHIRSDRWYTIGGIAVVLMAVYGIITGAWTFSVVIVLCGAMYVLLRNHTPPLRSIALYEHGVRYEESFIRWEDITGFWFVHAHDFTELHLEKKTKDREIVIHVRGIEVEQLKTILSHFTPELMEKKERLLDIFTRLCKL
jgi:hypothetical protein